MARLCVVVEREREKRESERRLLEGGGVGRPPRSCVSARGNTCHTCINNSQKVRYRGEGPAAMCEVS